MAYAVPSSYLLDKQILQDLDASSATQAGHDLGFSSDTKDGRRFMYVHLDPGSIAGSAGYPIWFYASIGTGADYRYNVSSDYSDIEGNADIIGGHFAGVSCVAPSASAQYIWIQTKGFCNASVSTAVVAKDTLKANQDYLLETYDPATEASSHLVAIALEADASGFADIIIL